MVVKGSIYRVFGLGSLAPPCHDRENDASQFSIMGRYVPSWHDASYKICFKLILLARCSWANFLQFLLLLCNFFNSCFFIK